MFIYTKEKDISLLFEYKSIYNDTQKDKARLCICHVLFDNIDGM